MNAYEYYLLETIRLGANYLYLRGMFNVTQPCAKKAKKKLLKKKKLHKN